MCSMILRGPQERPDNSPGVLCAIPAMNRSSARRRRSSSLVRTSAADSQSTAVPSARAAATSSSGSSLATLELLGQTEECSGGRHACGVPRRLPERLGHLFVRQPHFHPRNDQVALWLAEPRQRRIVAIELLLPDGGLERRRAVPGSLIVEIFKGWSPPLTPKFVANPVHHG